MNGVHPKVMQELAGHYSSQITMDIYTHVNMDSKRQAVAALSGAF
jgi:integrase